MKRTLTLKRESLSELTTDALRDVVGAASGTSCPICVVDLSRKIGCEGSYDCPTWTC